MSLKNLTVRELRKLAAKYKIQGRSKMRKADLIHAIEPFMTKKQDTKPEKSTPKEVKQSPKIPARPEISAQEAFLMEEEAMTLPFSYNEDMIELLPKNPEQLYAYWDLSTKTWEQVADKNMLVLQLKTDEDRLILETMIPNNARDYYFKVPDNRGPYKVILGMQDDNGNMMKLMESGPIKVPPNHPGHGELRFAKVPFGISLPELRQKGGPMAPAPSEMPKGDFPSAETDDTPYTRRFL